MKILIKKSNSGPVPNALAKVHQSHLKDLEPALRIEYWVQKDRSFIRIKEMETGHLYNSIRLVWNHSVPKEMRLGRRTSRTLGGLKYRQKQLPYLIEELESRKDKLRHHIAMMDKIKAFNLIFPVFEPRN